MFAIGKQSEWPATGVSCEQLARGACLINIRSAGILQQRARVHPRNRLRISPITGERKLQVVCAPKIHNSRSIGT